MSHDQMRARAEMWLNHAARQIELGRRRMKRGSAESARAAAASAREMLRHARAWTERAASR